MLGVDRQALEAREVGALVSKPLDEEARKCSPECRGGIHRGVDCAFVRRALAVEMARIEARTFTSVNGGKRCPWCSLLLPCGC